MKITNRWRASTATTAVECFSTTQGRGHFYEEDRVRAMDLISSLTHFLRLNCGLSFEEAKSVIAAAVDRGEVEMKEDPDD